MALTDTAIRNAKGGPKAVKLADERGLFLLVQPSGGKLWRLKYRFGGKEKKLSLGRYPDVSLKEARKRRDDARIKIALGSDPGDEKRREKIQSDVEESSRFETVANEYLTKVESEGQQAVTLRKSRWLLSLLAPTLGSKNVGAISPVELLEALRIVERKGQLETARRMRSFAGRVFRYAVATSRAETDPSSVLKGALTAPRVRHHSAILDPTEAGRLLLCIDDYVGQPLIHLALKLTPHVFVRPGELRRAEWHEVDFKAEVWTIPAEKMKMRQAHRIPLSRQALEILSSASVLSRGQKYIFSALYPGDRPMSENTINAALRRMGYGKDEMTAHGFRAMASTLLNESGLWNPDAIELALAHDIGGSVRGTYHRGTHWDERKRMAQWWSDYLDQLKVSSAAGSSANHRNKGVLKAPTV
ncbi:integrase arm-type DNA-binding domain-containing protein [Novosphingobium sp.]|uniref:tyrosine-type recombinase/integrase n=1 Tax=Novosphingobium sp. TaxID=1874826 RepID=UPI0025CEAAC4|nr:integrase arm-type DNA-binding domain-containing protein [Novosphingobium sp.]